MNRLVVKEVPKGSSPKVVTSKVAIVEEGGNKVQKTVNVESPWPLDPDVARLIGEAKSLPSSLSVKLTEAIFILLNPSEVAWYVENKGLSLLHLEGVFYLGRRKGGNQ